MAEKGDRVAGSIEPVNFPWVRERSENFKLGWGRLDNDAILSDYVHAGIQNGIGITVMQVKHLL